MYKKLGDGHCLSDSIKNEEVFPIGGSVRGELNACVTIDRDCFEPFFERVAKNAKNLQQNKDYLEWFSKLNNQLDYSIFCHATAFNMVIDEMFPHITENMKARTQYYDTNGSKKLSDAVADKCCACAEYAILAQMYFQTQGVPTRYACGELVANGNFDNFEEHSFIVFQNNGKKYVYDPVNPVVLGRQKLPRISEFTEDKDNFYLKTKGLLNQDCWYYACGDAGEFLKNMPQKSDLRGMLGNSQVQQIKTKEVQNV